MSDEHKHEIVIIHRGGHGDHDDHHGGAWKIAFADFMTAMMAFFLVMWLVSANDKTRATVARYFNPVRLVDATTAPRGLNESKKEDAGPADKSKDNKAPEASKEAKDAKKAPDEAPAKPEAPKSESPKPEAPKPETSAAKEKRLDSALRDNPYVALAEIASAKGQGDVPKMQDIHSAAAVVGRRGGDAFRDPFEPQPAPVAESDTASEAIKALTEQPAEGAKAAAVKADAAQHDMGKLTAATNLDATKTDAAKTDAAAKTASERLAKEKVADADSALKERLVASVKTGGGETSGPGVDVRRTDEGLVVSLTDTSDFSMFANGSAVPARRVVLLMEKVASILKERPGSVVIRGFTDNKPFKSGRYDNWHLSLDRAQVTHYMLVRGGFDDTRIGHIEGFADRGTQAGVDPASPLNRRIEILLKDKML